MSAVNTYLNILGSNAGAVSQIAALQSLDATVKKNDTTIKALEKSYADATAAAQKAKAAGDMAGAAKATQEAVKAGEKLAATREKQAVATAKQDIYKKGLDKQVEATRAAQAAEAQRAAQSKGLVAALESIKTTMGSIGEQAQAAGGPIGSLASSIANVGRMGPVGAVLALVAALAAVAAAAVVAAVALARYAFAASDAARSSKLTSEAFLGTGSAAHELETVVDQMTDVAPGLATKLKEVGRSLADVDIRGRDAQRALNAFRIVAGSTGEQAAAKITSIAEASRMANRLMLGPFNRITGQFDSLRGTGIKSAEVFKAIAKTMGTSEDAARKAVQSGLVPYRKGLEAIEFAAEASLGRNVAKQMMSLSNQSAKLKENIGKIFAGANLEPFLEGLKTVTDLFDTNRVTGYVLREVMTAVFTKIAEVAAKVFPYVKAAIMGVVAGIIITADVAKRLYRTLSETFAGAGKNIDGISLAFKAGVAIVGFMVGSVVALTLAITALGAIAVVALAPIWLPFALAAVLIYGVVKAITAVIDEAKSLGKEIAQIDLAGAAGKMIDGLIKGIQSKIADVKSAILEVSGAITSAFNSDQEIRSPGRKAFRQSTNVMRGHENAIVQSAPRLEAATMKASGAITQGFESSGAPGPTTPSASPGPTFSFTNCTFGTVTQEQIEEMFAIVCMKQARGYAMGAS